MPTPTARQKGAMLHPERLRIAAEFALGEALTAAQVHERLPDLSTASLYRHLAKLIEEGVLTIRETHAKRGTLEKTYALAVSFAFTPKDVIDDPSMLMRLAAMASAMLLRLFTAYAKLPKARRRATEPAMRFYAVEATDAEFAELSRAISHLLIDAAKPHTAAPGRRKRRMFFFAAVPETT